MAVRILKNNIGSEIAKRFPFILIDECQDLSGNELEVLRQLKENGCCIHFIGDLNQSIYEFKRVSPDNIADYVKDFEKYTLSNNFRSCTEIVSFQKKLIGKSGSISQNVESKFGNHSLVYIEYRTPEEAIEKYVRLLDSMGCKEYDNKILVKQNALRKQLEKTTQNEFDTKELLLDKTRFDIQEMIKKYGGIFRGHLHRKACFDRTAPASAGCVRLRRRAKDPSGFLQSSGQCDQIQ